MSYLKTSHFGNAVSGIKSFKGLNTSSGHNHFWISVSSFVIGWDQNQNKANLAERCWKQEEADFFFFVAAML